MPLGSIDMSSGSPGDRDTCSPFTFCLQNALVKDGVF